MKTTVINEVEDKFYNVVANFDMSIYCEVKVKSFRKLENANKFGNEMKEKFLSNIPNRKLNEDETDEQTDEFFYFYGVSKNGDHIVTIEVHSANFEDVK